MNIAYIGPGAGALLSLIPFVLAALGAVVLILVVAVVVLIRFRKTPSPPQLAADAVQQTNATDDASRRS